MVTGQRTSLRDAAKVKHYGPVEPDAIGFEPDVAPSCSVDRCRMAGVAWDEAAPPHDRADRRIEQPIAQRGPEQSPAQNHHGPGVQRHGLAARKAIDPR
jgi:hypothetical protein